MTTEPADAAGGSTTVCHHCGDTVPVGEFCGACGAHLVADRPGAANRRHTFAADPSEHVFNLAAVSTLLPYLPRGRTQTFRVALLLAAAVLLGLGLLRLTAPAIAAAALFMPALYLLYLYEIEVYEDEPVKVVGLTFGAGALLGIPWAYFVGPYISQILLLNVAQTASARQIVLAAVILPLLAQAVMLIGPTLLYRSRRFDEALDGFSFGAASALGFVLTTTMVNLWPELRAGLFAPTTAGENTLTILQRGLLIPFIHAGTTGLIAAALWLRRGRLRESRRSTWTTDPPVMLLVAVVVQVALGVTDVYASNAELAVAAYAIVALALHLVVRAALHQMLLAEAASVTIGPEQPCSHCGRIVPRMAFCPNCGVATRATPKVGVGRIGRAVR